MKPVSQLIPLREASEQITKLEEVFQIISEKKIEETSPKCASPPIVQRLKYEMCKNWRERGVCKYGDKCLFAHGEKELTKRTTAPENKPEPNP